MQSFPDLLNDLAKAIRHLREPTGLSQQGLADASKLHRTKIGNLEGGEGNPTLETLYLVAGGLGVNVADLFALAARAGEETLAEAGLPPQGKAPSEAQSRKRARTSSTLAKHARSGRRK
jgi:transcriptional regulator with XRE-family HTH domain